jgi:hypothetical protein
MRKLGTAITLGLVLWAATTAQAKPAHADTLVVSGKWKTASNWSAGHVPTVEEEAVVPAGKEVVISQPATSGPLNVQGRISGASALNVYGSLTVAPGAWNEVGQLDLLGWGTVRAEDELEYVRMDGNETLAAPLRAEVLTAYHGSTFVTNGYPVDVEGETYPFGEANWLLGTSTYESGYWLSFDKENAGDLHAEEASIVIGGEGGELGGGLFKGAGWTYGNVTFNTNTGNSRGDYRVLGALTIHGHTTLESGHRVTAGSLAGEGTLSSSKPGEPAFVRCGCEVPLGLTLTDVIVE